MNYKMRNPISILQRSLWRLEEEFKSLPENLNKEKQEHAILLKMEISDITKAIAILKEA